jgi:Ca2+:H+ antiporter
MLNKVFVGLLVVAPLALVANFADTSPVLVFCLSALAIVPLAKFLGEATEELASHSGPALGGLLNATFGNATELIIAIFALNAGLIEVVKASITGSIVGNLLLVLGMSILIGGWRHKKQQFNKTAALASASTLFLAVIALVIPEFFFYSSPHADKATIQDLSTVVAILMFIIYFASLAFIFRTHSHLYAEEVGKYEPKWSINKSIAILTCSTIGVAIMSEILVNAIKPTLEGLGWTELFIGGVIVAIIGNAAEHFAAITMAAKNRIDLSLQIAIGSATQIALFVVPVLVFVSIIINHEMNLVFGVFELVTIVVSVMIANLIVQDGESNWLEGAQLLAAYCIIAIAFYFHP